MRKEVWPAVVLDETGANRGAVLLNGKAAQKSLEQGEPWVVHPQTARVLPLAGGAKLVSLEEQEGWYRMTVAGLAAGDVTLPEAAADEEDTAALKAEGAGGGGKSSGEVLEGLAAVIRQRHREMPEGSYTTHLFKKGVEKIRKKTGEEAVELILARSADEMRCEAADLIYHMLVLLEAADVPLADVLAELESR